MSIQANPLGPKSFFNPNYNPDLKLPPGVEPGIRLHVPSFNRQLGNPGLPSPTSLSGNQTSTPEKEVPSFDIGSHSLSENRENSEVTQLVFRNNKNVV